MRIDDYLSTVFLIKRRTLAKDWIMGGKVRLNDKRIKAGHEVKIGDRIEIYYAEHKISIEVLEIPVKSVSRKAAQNFYRLREDIKT